MIFYVETICWDIAKKFYLGTEEISEAADLRQFGSETIGDTNAHERVVVAW